MDPGHQLLSGVSHHFRAFVLLMVALSSSAWAVEVEATLTSAFLVRGERARLRVVIDGGQPDRAPRLPEVPGLTIRPEDNGRARTIPLDRRRVGHAYSYSILSYDVGRHLIPSIVVDVGGHSFRTRPLPVEIFGSDELTWADLPVGGETVRLGTAFRVGETQPFVNQALAVELKVYFPSDLRVEDSGIPDFERDGVAAWRFEPNRERSKVVLKARSFAGTAYPSTLVPNREGDIAIGPARLRLVVVQLTPDAFGFIPREFPLWLDVPATKLSARPLPPGAPDGFSNAVGSFTLSNSIETYEVREGDPVVVNLEITGEGNLDSLAAPTPTEHDGWKLYQATAMPRGTERRKLAGTIRFRQFMRPLEFKTSVPPFQFAYFDPVREEYRSLFTDPIPLRLLPSAVPAVAGAAPPPEAAMPVERMTDILGAVATTPLGGSARIPWRLLWQLLPATIVLLLLLRIAWQHLAPRLQKNPQNLECRREFSRLSRSHKNDDIRGFYRAAGAFVERWFGGDIDSDADLARILSDRDQRCFNPDADGSGLTNSERRRVLRTLRRHLTLIAFALFVTASSHPIRAQEAAPELLPPTAADAYAEGRYAEAARLWLGDAPFGKLDADRLHNIGNCWYRLGSAGQAALFYRRALTHDPGHAESRQNLRFLERKFGSLSIKRPEYQYVLAKLPLSFWQGLVWTGGWLVAIGLLCFPATHRDSRSRLLGVIALVIAPIATGIGALGWRYFPDDAEFAPLVERAVVIADDAALFTDATRTSAEIIDAPPGSLCRVVADRGRWVYVAFATHTRGWLPAEQIERIVPDDPPPPPSAPRPKATESST